MDELIMQFFSLPTLVLCLVIWCLVWVARKVTEYAWKGSKANKLWNELGLPVLPLGVGALIGLLAKQYPFPDVFGASVSGRVFFAVVCGLASAHVYRIVKKFLKTKEGEGPTDADLENLTK